MFTTSRIGASIDFADGAFQLISRLIAADYGRFADLLLAGQATGCMSCIGWQNPWLLQALDNFAAPSCPAVRISVAHPAPTQEHTGKSGTGKHDN